MKKPLEEWAVVPMWVVKKFMGDVCTELNLKTWACDGPRLCWPEDLEKKNDQPYPSR